MIKKKLTPHENMLITVKALEERKALKLKRIQRKEYDKKRHKHDKELRLEKEAKWNI